MIREATSTTVPTRFDGWLFEHYRALAERVRQLQRDDQTLKVVGVTSCTPGEGVSTVTANLAATAASVFDWPVLLIDGNLARPSLAAWFGDIRREGLADVLIGSGEAADVVRDAPEPNLSILTAGTAVARTRAGFDPACIQQLLVSLKSEYGLILIDLAAATQTSTCWSFASALDGVLLVLEAERVATQVAQQVKQKLIAAGTTPLGVVLNKHREHLPAWLNRV